MRARISSEYELLNRSPLTGLEIVFVPRAIDSSAPNGAVSLQPTNAIDIKREFIRTHTPGLILCAEKDSAVAKNALEGLPNRVLAAEYKLALLDEKRLVSELKATQKRIFARKSN